MACFSSGSACLSGSCMSNGEDATPGEAFDKMDAKQCAKCGGGMPFSIRTLGGSDLCETCFRSNIYGKFRIAVTTHSMITPSDDVLIALSGGHSSRVLLQFVHELQQRKQENFDACKDRALPVFGASAVFVDERAVHPGCYEKFDEAIKVMSSTVEHLFPATIRFFVVPIESVYPNDVVDRKQKLVDLLGALEDETGKEDLLHHLRMLALQKAAVENGCSRIILGTCTSTLARHVLSATVKGKGYSLSSDIHYVNAKFDIPVALPLRDCTAHELKLICTLDGLKTAEVPAKLSSSSINTLIDSFVTKLQAENHSRECTIVRTAGKLTPFSFNRVLHVDDSVTPMATVRRVKKQLVGSSERITAGAFCSVCLTPMKKEESPKETSFKASCCHSCQFQILPKEPSAMERFHSLLPKQNRPELSSLREEIEDFLLSSSDDET